RLAEQRGLRVADLPIEGYLIHAMPDALLIAGKDKPILTYRGDGKTVAKTDDDPLADFTHPASLFGVCAWLEEELGVRWIMPGKLGEVIPPRADIAITPVPPRIGKPAAAQRQIRFVDATAARQKKGAPQNANLAQRVAETRLWMRRQRLGRAGYFHVSHAFTKWWDTYSKDHPDYFAQQLDGTRQWPECWPKETVRLCVSNPAVVDQIIQNAKAAAAAQARSSNLDYLAFSACQNDGNCGWCLCDKCRALDPPEAPKALFPYVLKGKHGAWVEKKVELPRLTDRYVHFWNEVARRAEKELPGQMVGVFAYGVTASPPVRERYAPNLICAFVVADCLIAPRGAGLAKLRDAVQKFYDAGLRNWYWRPNLMYYDMFGLPLIYAREAGEMFQYAMSRGAIGVDIDSWQGHWAADGINVYVLARLLWDPKRSVDSLIDEYCAAFGNAAPTVKLYFTRLEAMRDTMPPALSDKRKRLTQIPDVYTPDVLDELDALLAKAARQAATDTPIVQQRVRFLGLALQYARLQRNVLDINRRFNVTGQGFQDLLKAIQAREDFYKTLSNPWAINLDHLKWWEKEGKMSPYFATHYLGMTAGKTVVAALPQRWKFYLDLDNDGEKRNLTNGQFDDEPLVSISVLDHWENQGFPSLNGIAWYRARFTPPAGLKGRKLYLCFGGVDESCWIYVNGQKVAESIYDKDTNPNSWTTPILADITEAAKPGEENLVSVRVRDVGGVGGIYRPVLLLADPE
ncbi:MAG TPA: DUF4838 domain-containing protein, partial [Candidatus Brocadiia bacterium]|nr:DUF4838 domain-containing protein [Candidatus Brocadiia bacterium]